tara:strand:+ start:47 stop:433 length:387 start_codon:yes stop_codon:yes gene_type:complete
MNKKPEAFVRDIKLHNENDIAEWTFKDIGFHLIITAIFAVIYIGVGYYYELNRELMFIFGLPVLYLGILLILVMDKIYTGTFSTGNNLELIIRHNAENRDQLLERLSIRESNRNKDYDEDYSDDYEND